MKHLPNLLKQESSSAATLVHVLLRMYYDPRPEHQALKSQVADDRLLPYEFSLFTKLLLIHFRYAGWGWACCAISVI
jgi:brefeldin A-inhibited guanine nucleotide-exchange protein